MNERLPFGDWTGALRTAVPGPESKRLAQRLQAVETPGVTYLAPDFPVFWKRAYGSNVEDVDGNFFVDFTSAFGVTALGHGDRQIVQAISRQLETLIHGMGDMHPSRLKVEFLEKLALLFPEPGAQTLLANSGAESVEIALKTALLATGKPGVITFEGGYHGLSYGTLAVGGQLRFREPFLPQIKRFAHQAHFPQVGGDENPQRITNSLNQLQELVEQAPIGAILLEPIQGRGGIRVPPPGWLKAVRQFTEERKILLIVDEIQTGFGRSGKIFACEHEEVVPDLICVGKALTGSLPFAACLGRRQVMEAWPASDGEAMHTSTFLGHPLGCAAALAAISELQRRELPARAAKLGRQMHREIQSWRRQLPIIREVRGRGFMLGIELARDDHAKGLAMDLTRQVLAEGLIVLPCGTEGNVVSLLPALTVSGRQIEWTLDVLHSSLRKMTMN